MRLGKRESCQEDRPDPATLTAARLRILEIELFPDLAPAPGEHSIKKHRYSAFVATDLDLISRETGIDTLIVLASSTAHMMSVDELKSRVAPTASRCRIVP